MNLLDENIPRLQWEWLRQAGIPVRQIGFEFAYSSIADDSILVLLHRVKRVTFFTQDRDFFQWRLCHRAYCLVKLDVDPDDTGEYIRRFLRQPGFKTEAERLGKVVRVHADGIQFWVTRSARRNRERWLKR